MNNKEETPSSESKKDDFEAPALSDLEKKEVKKFKKMAPKVKISEEAPGSYHPCLICDYNGFVLRGRKLWNIDTSHAEHDR